MKKIIDGKMFNTETAQKMAHHIYKHDATLYKKNDDEYFFYKINTTHGKKTCEIEIIDIVEAKQFCEYALKTEEYETLWGEVAE